MISARLNKKDIKQLLKEKKYDDLRKSFACTDPADVADLLDELDSEELEQVFSILDNEMASEVIVEMDQDEIEDIVENMLPSKLAGMIQEMAPDDAADFLKEFDANEQNQILHLLSPTKKKELKLLAKYDEDSAGGLMTPEFCAVSSDATVEQAINAMAAADFSDPVTTVFSVDREGRLNGSINISELISKQGKALIKDVVDSRPVFATVDEDGSVVAHKVRKYDLLVIPVVDKDQKLLGRITIDDIIDFIDEEAAEDMARMSGAPDIEHKEFSPLAIVRLRLPWLLITMFTGTIVSFIVQKIMDLPSAGYLAAFVPVILGMGGNTGMQATAVTVRSIALGEIEFSSLAGVFCREIMVGAIMGSVCGMLIAGVVCVNISLFSATAVLPAFLAKLVLVVGISMFSGMTFAAFTGTILPIVLHRFKVDPAVASGPFVSTSNDLSASLIYLGMCYWLLNL
ncbi:MAG: magnesium transporter [Victivallaceae bacterium]